MSDYSPCAALDWKLSVAGMTPPNAILGFDLAGTVVALGQDLKNSTLKVGDPVAAMVSGGRVADEGAYAGTSSPFFPMRKPALIRCAFSHHNTHERTLTSYGPSRQL